MQTTSNNVRTCRLKNGQVVLSKDGTNPATFVNRTQATKKMEIYRGIGYEVFVYQVPGNRVVFYVAFTTI